MAETQPVVRGGFQYNGAFTTTDGVSFEPLERLSRLCFPGNPDMWKLRPGRGRPRKVDEVSADEARRTLSKKFVLAQYRFYGLPAPHRASGEEAVRLFREHVGDGKVRPTHKWPTGPHS